MRSAFYGLVLALISLAQIANASRLPEPGGSIHVALSAELEQAFWLAHIATPLLEPSQAVRGWRSTFITSLSPNGSHTRWVFEAAQDPRQLKKSLERCLKSGERWPAKLLRVANISSKIVRSENRVTISWSHPVGPLPELLQGCTWESEKSTVSRQRGPFKPLGDDGLIANSDSVLPRPLVDRVVLAKDGYSADLKLGMDFIGDNRTVLLAPYPDLLLLIQTAASLNSDPLGIVESPLGLEVLYHHFGSEILVSMYGEGRGMEFRAILPPGLAPPRPLHQPREASDGFAALHLPAQVDATNPISVRCAVSSVLGQGVCDRLAMIVRGRGRLAQVSADESEPWGLSIVNWRSVSRDPGLALLDLLAKNPSIISLFETSQMLPLLGADKAARLEAAMSFERKLIESRAVIPLLLVDRVYEIHPELMGVRIRDDGIPLVADAWWGNSP